MARRATPTLPSTLTPGSSPTPPAPASGTAGIAGSPGTPGAPPRHSLLGNFLLSIRRWGDASALDDDRFASDTRVDWFGVVPFLIMHLGCLAVFWVGLSPAAVGLALLFYLARMFFITGFYHRYFSHRSFRTSRPFQFLMAVAGATAVQRSALWWAAHHRHHHKHSDRDEDPHSPRLLGFLKAHAGWFLTRSNYRTRRPLVRDWMRFPELAALDRYDVLVPILTGAAIWGLGAAMAQWLPGLGVTGAQLFVWCFLISTVVGYHATFTINSIAHGLGSRRFDTDDDSRNNLALALLTLGEGWHNNHHHYPSAARQGFYWWEIDMTYYLLLLLARLGLVWDLRPVPARALQRARIDRRPPPR